MDERYAPPAEDGAPRTKSGSASAYEFEYFVQPSGARAPIGCLVVIVPGAVAALLGIVNLTTYAVPAAILTAAWLWWRARHHVARPQATLSVEGSRLRVLNRHWNEIASMRLSELLDVELDTKTIQRVEDNRNSGVLPHFSLLHGRVGSATDVSRIVLVTSRQDIPLTDERLSISYTMDSFGEMRTFLRRHGWLPEAERAGTKSGRMNENS